MIESILKPFDFALSLTLEQQFEITVAGCSFCFVAAALLRELVGNPGVRMAARVLGCGAFFAIVCYSLFATRVAEERGAELMVHRAHRASEIAKENEVVFITKHGHRLGTGEAHGMRGTAEKFGQHAGRLRCGDASRDASSDGFTRSPIRDDGRNGRRDDGVLDAARVLEWADRFAASLRGGRSVPVTGEIEGVNF